jgi:hypothetical protein
MSQFVKRAEVFLREPRPPLTVGWCPQVAGQASDEALAAIVDLDEGLLAMIAAVHGSYCRLWAAVLGPFLEARRGPSGRAAALPVVILASRPAPKVRPLLITTYPNCPGSTGAFFCGGRRETLKRVNRLSGLRR